MVRTYLLSLALAALSIGLAQPAPSDPDFDWVDQGRSVYNANCASCHGPQGAGIAGAFPPVSGHSSELFNREGGPAYLLDVMLYGLQGEIEVAGTTYNGAMPGWQHLDDAAIAAVVNHLVTAWDDGAALDDDVVLLAPADVAGQRDQGLSAADVLERRVALLGGELAAVEATEVAVLNDDVGYFTQSQADRGRSLYEEHCASCHGATLRGGPHEPPLTQLGFFRTWGDRTFDVLVAYYSASMPFGTSTRLTESEYVLIGAYWLAFHDYPAGDVPLTSDPAQLRQIVIERRR